MKKRTVSVVGLGYVGLPLALRCLEKDYPVFGIDLDKSKLEKIKKGQNPFKEEFIEKRKDLLNKINVSSDFSPIKRSDIVIVCVPTPVDKNFYPVLEPLISAVTGIATNLKKGQLVIIESTINPGVCEEIVEPIFAKEGFTEGKDYYLAHCPERINPGDPNWNVTNINRVVGALSSKGLHLVKEFYEDIIEAQIKPMKSIREAEAVKIIENSFRDINIAFVNELAQSFDHLGIDLKDVIEGAATKPFAFMPHFPSCGVGGHCIPVDPYYLIERAKKSGFDHKFLRTARSINNFMPLYTVELLQDLLNEVKMPINGTSIGIMGLSYKANVDDLRESPSLKIIELLKKRGAKIVTFDPYVPNKSNAKNLNDFLKKTQAVILATNHKEFIEMDLTLLKKNGIRAIVDGKNCLDGQKIKALGIKYHGIGRS